MVHSYGVQNGATFKHPKTGGYYFRKVVPERLREIVGKRELKISLQTKETKLARERFVAIAAEIAREWEELENRAQTETELRVVTLSHQERIALSGELYRQTLDKYANDTRGPSGWDEKIQSLRNCLPFSHDASAKRTGVGYAFGPLNTARLIIGREVSNLLVEKGLALHYPDKGTFFVECAAALADAYATLKQRSKGNYGEDNPEAVTEADAISWKEKRLQEVSARTVRC